jgi:hypothetical protein
MSITIHSLLTYHLTLIFSKFFRISGKMVIVCQIFQIKKIEKWTMSKGLQWK